MIGVLDYGVGNVKAFLRIFYLNGIAAKAISKFDDYESVTKLILPGVGAFDASMHKLNESGLRSKLDILVMEEKMPLLGVCIGMHMLGQKSEEGQSDGLGYIYGETKQMTSIDDKCIPLPHMGWNDINATGDDLIWRNVIANEGFYFLHSYAFIPNDNSSIIASSHYGKKFACGIKSNNIYGFQFHPEKSLHNGINLLKNFSNL